MHIWCGISGMLYKNMNVIQAYRQALSTNFISANDNKFDI